MRIVNVNEDTTMRVGLEDSVKRSTMANKFALVMGLLLSVSLALFMFAGCSTNSVSNDDHVTDGKLVYLFDATHRDHNQAGPALFELTEVAVSEVVGLVGGTIEVAGDISADFVVPAGALLAPVEIRIEASELQTPLGPIYIYDCGPDGTRFRVPAKLQQPITTGQPFAFLYYFNEATGQWELQETVKVKNGVATFNIKHFSKYGIS
jgi:hypothetical protein